MPQKKMLRFCRQNSVYLIRKRRLYNNNVFLVKTRRFVSCRAQVDSS